MQLRDGFIIGSDSRTTNCSDKNVSYRDSTEKTIVFNNELVVSHCGNDMITKDISVTRFLSDLKKDMKSSADIDSLPLQILNRCIDLNKNSNVTFLITGKTQQNKQEGYLTYCVETNPKELRLVFPFGQHGATYRGITSVTNAIFNSGINYDLLNIQDGIELMKCGMNASVIASKFNRSQSVGGPCRFYIADKIHDYYGWDKSEAK